MAIELNKVVTLNFTLSDETGNVLDSTDQGGPFSYISGSGMVLPCLLYTSPSPRDRTRSRMPSSA